MTHLLYEYLLSNLQVSLVLYAGECAVCCEDKDQDDKEADERYQHKHLEHDVDAERRKEEPQIIPLLLVVRLQPLRDHDRGEDLRKQYADDVEHEQRDR